MFTGLVEDVGTVVQIAPARAGQGSRVVVETRLPAAGLFLGASVAVDGACLTVVERQGDRVAFDASIETLQRTTLGERRAGDRVNLELPLALGDRLGGHLVLGHVDGVGKLLGREAAGDAVRISVEVPRALGPLIVEKGSIALDGISLTVNGLADAAGGTRVELMIIPETLRATTWGDKRAGAAVNVEADILGKHVARLLGARAGNSVLDLQTLQNAGFAVEQKR